jgi:hypothetical protein
MKYLLLTLAVFAWSCEDNQQQAAYSENTASAPALFEKSTDANEGAYEVKRLELQVVVHDLTDAENWLKEQTTAMQGKVAGNTRFNESQNRSSQLSLQVPVKQLDGWVAVVEQRHGWKINSKQMSATNIEQQYVDHAQRLKTRQALEQRYTELLQQAKSMTDVLAIEEKLLQLRSEIEWMQSEKSSMDNQMAFVECSVRLVEQLSAWQRLTRSSAEQFREGWHVLVNLLLFLLKIWPLLLLGWAGYALYQKRKSRKA